MSTNNSRDILACIRQVLSRESTRVEQAKRSPKRVRSSRRRQNFSEEIRQVGRVTARRRRENYGEKNIKEERSKKNCH